MKKIYYSLMASTMLVLSGCSSLPNTGPGVSTIRNTEENSVASGGNTIVNGVSVVRMTSLLAAKMMNENQTKIHNDIENNIRILGEGQVSTDHHLEAGDIISVGLWTYSPWPGGNSGGGMGSPNTINAGQFEIDSHGFIDLPYAKKVHIAGLTTIQAQEAISSQYSRLGILQKPSVTIGLTENVTNGVVVTGALGQPKIVPWNSGGLTIAKAITIALGNGAEVLGEQQNASLNGDSSAVNVTVVRRGIEPVTLPIDVAFKNDIPVLETDKLIVNRKPSVRVTVMGGGISKNGLYSFGDHPSLAQAIAQAQGLSPSSADSRAVFVYRTDKKGNRSLFDFSWNKGDTILASQEFPLEDNDIIYVAEAPIVPVTRILNIIMQLAVFASIAR